MSEKRNGHDAVGADDVGRQVETGADAAHDSPEIAELQSDIERTREDLAETVDALAAKLDVKSRVRDRVVETKEDAASKLRALQDRATNDQGKPTRATLGVGGGAAAALAAILVVVIWRRRTNRPHRLKRRVKRSLS